MRALLATLALLSLAFAGCSSNDSSNDHPEDDDEDTTLPPPPPPPPPAAPPPPPPPAPPANHAPEAGLSASIQQGDLPLLVNFTVDASDEDEDLLTWALDADEDGTADAEGEGPFPLVVNFTYESAGLYNATLTVTDGDDTATAVLLLNVTAAPAGLLLLAAVAEPCKECSLGPVAANEPTGEAPPLPSPLYCGSFVTGEAGTDCAWFELTADMKGKEFTATSTGGNPDMVFTNTCSFPADSEAEEPEPYDPESEAFFVEVGAEVGTIPDDADCVILWEFEAAGAQTISLLIV